MKFIHKVRNHKKKGQVWFRTLSTTFSVLELSPCYFGLYLPLFLFWSYPPVISDFTYHFFCSRVISLLFQALPTTFSVLELFSCYFRLYLPLFLFWSYPPVYFISKWRHLCLKDIFFYFVIFLTAHLNIWKFQQILEIIIIELC